MKSKLLKRVIESKYYYANRMETMSSNCSYYLNLGIKENNNILRKAFIETAKRYKKKYEYYFKKMSETRIFA